MGEIFRDSIENECHACIFTKEEKMVKCSFCMAQKIIKGKWKLLIIRDLQNKTKRFSEIQKDISITQSSLSKQLRELEEDGIVLRKAFDEIPPRVEYSLSPIGHRFVSVLKELDNWGIDYIKYTIENKGRSKN